MTPDRVTESFASVLVLTRQVHTSATIVHLRGARSPNMLLRYIDYSELKTLANSSCKKGILTFLLLPAGGR